MSAPNPLAGTAEDFTQNDWKELVANFRPSGENMFSQKGGECALIGLVDATKTFGALRYILGYNYVGGTPTITLQRTNPVKHPRYPGCYAVAAAETEFVPNAAQLKTIAFDDGSGNPGLGYRTKYKKAHITIRFSAPDYTILDDSAVPDRQEWLRNTSIDQEPKTEILSLSGFQLIYTEGTGTTPPISSPQGKQYPAEIGQVLIKSDLRVVWNLVPSSLLMLTGTQVPKWILYCLGKVNNSDFMSYTAGTLMLSGVKLTRHAWPLVRGDEDKFVYTVEFLMSFFDPPKGYTGTPEVLITTNRGWNNAPFRGSFVAGDKNAGRWFLSSYDGSSTGQKQFGTVNFANLFQSANNPEIA